MARVIMVASGKGGTGKSTISAFLAHELAFKGHKTFLTELDMGFRSIDVISAVSEDTVYDLGDVLEGACPVEKAVIVSPYCPKLHIMAAPGRKDSGGLDKFKQLVDSLYDKYDFIILDTAAGIGQSFAAALNAANSAIVVATPDMVSVKDARIISDEIFYSGITDVKLIINKYDKDSFKHSGFDDGDSIIDAVCAQLLGVVPYDREMHMQAINGKALPANSTAKKIFSAVADRLMGNHTPIYVK